MSAATLMITLIVAVVSLLGAAPAIAATEPPTATGNPVLWHARGGLGIRSAVAWPAQAGISVASAAASDGVAFQPALPPPEPQPEPPPAGPGDAAGEASPSVPSEPSFPSEYDIVPPDTPGAAAPVPGAPGSGAAGVGSSCGLWDLGACINDWLRGAITEALNPGLELLSGTLLTTPTLEQMPRVAELWSRSWQILLACYGMLIMAAGVILMTHETLQTRYSLRELLPRLIVGFIAGAVSLVLAGMAIDVANALSAAVMTGGTDPDAGADVLADLLLGVVTNDGGLFLLLAAVVVTVMLIALLLVWVVRVVVTILLIAGAPIALMLHALPHTEGVARWWWRSFAGVLAIQVLQSLVLATAVQVLLNDGSQLATTMFGASTTTSSGLINILVSLTLLWILWKIPFWVLGTINGHGGRSFLGSALRTFLAYKTFGLVRGATSTLLTRSGSGKAGKPGGGAAGPGDPYAVERATPDGQLMLPLPGLGRGRRHRAPAATLARHTTGRHTTGQAATGRGGAPAVGQQLELPLAEGDWPEHRPRLGPDGQYRLPFPLTRVPRPAPPPPAGAPAPESGPDAGPEAGPEAGPPRGTQLRFPTSGDWPENRPRLGRDGQYQFPYPLTRAPRPTPPPAPTPPGSVPPAGRQLRFPTTGDWPEHRPRLGPDGQYRFPYPASLAPRPTPPPTTPPPRRTTRPTTGPEAGPGVGVPRGEQLPMFDLPSHPAPPTPTPPPDTSNPPTPASDPGPSPTPLPAVTPPVTPPGGPVSGRGPRKPRRPRRRPS